MAVIDALDVRLSVGVTLPVIVVVGVGVLLDVGVLEGVFEAVEPVESEGVGVGVDVGVAVPVGVGVAAATSENVVGEVSVYGATPTPGLCTLIYAAKLFPNPGMFWPRGHG